MKSPDEPQLSEKSVVIWQLYAFDLQEFAHDVLMQRVETAICLKRLREARVIQ